MSNNYSLNGCGSWNLPGLTDPSTQAGCKPLISFLESETIEYTGNGSICEPLKLEVKDAEKYLSAGWEWEYIKVPVFNLLAINRFSLAYDPVHNSVVVITTTGTSNQARYSFDRGTTWSTATTLTGNLGWSAICYGNGRLIAVSASVAGRCMFSTDGGITWVAPATTLPSAAWTNVCHVSGNTFVAVAGSTTSSAISTNGGVDWSTMTMPESILWADVKANPTTGRIIAIASSGTNRVVYSDTLGISWTASAGQGTFAFNSVTWIGGTTWILTNTNSPDSYSISTNDGATWTQTTFFGGWLGTLRAYYIDGDTIVMLGVGAQLFASVSQDKGQTWKRSFLDVNIVANAAVWTGEEFIIAVATNSHPSGLIIRSTKEKIVYP